MLLTLKNSLPYLLTVVASLLNWVFVEKLTAFEGPGLDMVVFFERASDPDYISEDFITNANQALNPRMIFGYGVIWISKILSVNWYTAFYFLKFFFVITIPLLWMEFITLCCLKIVSTNQKKEVISWLAAASVILAVVDHLPYVNDFGFLSIKGLFAIGWWPPLFTSTGAQTASIFFSLCASIQAINSNTKARFFNPYLIAATFIHPTIAIVGYVILILILASSVDSNKQQAIKERLVELALNWFLPCLVILVIFRPEHPLNATLFAYIYAFQAHPHHYSVKELASFTIFSWKFAFFNVLFICGFIFFIAKKFLNSFSVELLAAYFAIFYVVILAAQYFTIDIYPIKTLISFAPIRLSMISYWILSILCISCICSKKQNA
jgi:hypothetical protein